jgi:hypothetical protein
VSKPVCNRQVREVISLLVKVSPRIAFMRRVDIIDSWMRIAEGFEDTCGMDYVANAIDGTLIGTERPHDFTGWDNCKGLTSFNVQAIVRKRFIEYHISHGPSLLLD